MNKVLSAGFCLMPVVLKFVQQSVKKLKCQNIESQFKPSLLLFWVDCLSSACLSLNLLSAVFQGQCQDCKVGGPNLWACLEVRRTRSEAKEEIAPGLDVWQLDHVIFFLPRPVTSWSASTWFCFDPCRTAVRTSAAVNLTRTTAPCTHRWGSNWATKWQK